MEEDMYIENLRMQSVEDWWITSMTVLVGLLAAQEIFQDTLQMEAQALHVWTMTVSDRELVIVFVERIYHYSV